MGLRVAAALLITVSGLALAQDPPKPAPEQTAPPKPSAAPAEPVLSIEKSTTPPPCVIKPVMTDDELRACGARIPK